MASVAIIERNSRLERCILRAASNPLKPNITEVIRYDLAFTTAVAASSCPLMAAIAEVLLAFLAGRRIAK